MRSLLFILLAPFVVLAADELPQKTTPIFTKEPVGEAVTVTAVPQFSPGTTPRTSDAKLSLVQNSATVIYSNIHPKVAQRLAEAKASGKALKFTLQTYRSEGWPADRIYSQPELTRKPKKSGEATWSRAAYTYTTPAIVRIMDADEVMYDINLCEVHGVPLRVEKIPITYGLTIVSNRPLAATLIARFPHSESVILGGCCTTEINGERQEPSHKESYVCPECLKSRATWTKVPVESEADKRVDLEDQLTLLEKESPPPFPDSDGDFFRAIRRTKLLIELGRLDEAERTLPSSPKKQHLESVRDNMIKLLDSAKAASKNSPKSAVK